MHSSTANVKKLIKENKGFLLFIVLMSVCRSAIADWYTVPTGSMQPTIKVGDRITVDKMAYDLRLPFTDISLARLGEPKRGDILIFESDAAEKRMVKRVVGLPGDIIAMDNEIVAVNGVNLQYKMDSENASHVMLIEQLAGLDHKVKYDKLREPSLSTFGPVVVPEDHYLVLGDNRRNSADSRVYGFVPRHELRGKAHHVAFSLDYDDYYLPRSDRLLASLY